MNTKVTSETIKQHLLGTCNSEASAEDVFDLTYEQVLDLIIEAEIECCNRCGWWCEAHEMTEIECELICEDCLTDEEKENDE